MFKPGDRVQMYRNNEKITYIPKRYNGLTGKVVEGGSIDGKWVSVLEDGHKDHTWIIPIAYLKRI